MAYNKNIWTNNNLPAINDTNLNHIEEGIEAAHNAIDSTNTKLTSLTTYSTEEINTGKKWIDGKPIYSKTITYTVTGGTTTDISSLNIETVVDYNTICHRYGSNNNDWEEPFYNSTTDYFRSFIRTNTNTIETRITTGSAYTTYDITTTLYYTKTTDEV